ncbi:hypothetical protein BV372_05785 [Nostoc sp. T09]|uniref:hypothetical protein n=1 Tax=Nostoc sp. T09 TaxID=1932621 RepID=UPI000A380C61|nr:hypothetical protein [Nostoc sp. T09]OUL36791.1 hypothetical protein BV372_05785 [Nostoc sp. T09]
MNIHTFDNHYVTCPICQKNATPKPLKTCIGLFSCPYCQEKLVVCQSGHYVRDPFTLKQVMVSSALRRQSSPLARIIRDFVFLKRPVIALAMGSVMIMSMIALTQQNTSSEQQISPQAEKIDKKNQ